MPNQVKDLTGDQLRRIFRDFLAGRPKEKLMSKYDISEAVFWEIVGMYSKKKHPNDVGNAQDIEGPADVLVSPLDTGSTATEHPIVARNPEDLQVKREQVVKEFDYDSPEEELRKKGGEVAELVRQRTADEEKARQDEARGIIADNKEATDAILTELTATSKAGKEDIAAQAVERAKATPSPEEILTKRNEEQETLRRSEVAAEARRELTVMETRALADRDKALIEAGKVQNAEARAAESEARLKATQQLAQEVTSAGQESAGREGQAGGPTPAEAASPADTKREGEILKQLDKLSGTSGEGGEPNVSGSSGQGAGSDPGAPSKEGNLSGGAVTPANTSPTAQPNQVEPAKVEPDGLKAK